MTELPLCEREFDFTLVLTGGAGDFTDEMLDKLFGAGCDDSTPAVRSGRMVVTFDRRAVSMRAAILSAIRQVESVGLRVMRVDECDLVTQADIARRIDRSRQLVHQYMTGERGPGGFPGPICEIMDGKPLWHWCEVAYWLWENDMIKEDVLHDADDIDDINAALDVRNRAHRRPKLFAEVLRRLVDKDLRDLLTSE